MLGKRNNMEDVNYGRKISYLHDLIIKTEHKVRLVRTLKGMPPKHEINIAVNKLTNTIVLELVPQLLKALIDSDENLSRQYKFWKGIP